MAARWQWFGTYLICILLLIWPSLYNGYPFLYSDTAAYIHSGMRFDQPIDRPLTYGLFLRLTSLGGFTLWTTIACQAAIVVAMVHLLLETVTERSRNQRRSLIGVIAFLALFSSLPWVTSQVMADIFTPLVVLSALNLTIPRKKLSRSVNTFISVIFIVSVASHLSHFLLALTTLSIVALLQFHSEGLSWRRILRAPSIILIILTLVTYPLMSSSASGSRNVFFMGSMVEHGIARAYLAEHCRQDQFKLCKWRDRLPERSFEFVWNEKAAMGEYTNWQEASDEFGRIIEESLKEGRFRKLHAQASLTATIQQLKMYAIGDGWGSFSNGTSVHEVIAKHIPFDLPMLDQARQQAYATGLIPIFQQIGDLVMKISLISLIPLFLILLKRGEKQLVVVIVTSLSAIGMNAWICGTFSGAIDRLGCRMIWLIPFLAIMAMIVILKKELGSKNN